MTNHLKSPRGRKASPKSALAIPLMLCACLGWAAQTDILNAPPFIAGAVKPNILFLMDDSLSMERWWLPDQSLFWAPRTLFGTSDARYVKTDLAFWKADYGKAYLSYGHYSKQCNHLAYNPEVVYSPPLDDAGKPLDNASVADFWNPDYQPFYFVYQLPGINPPMNFDFKADDSVNQGYNPAGFFTECNAPIPNGHKDVPTAATPSKVFRKVEVNRSDVTPWEKQNFQNWLKYYGDRRGVLKTGVKQAFARVGGGYRVGFSVTSYEKADDNTTKKIWKFLDVKDFEEDQKKSFFTAVNNSDGYFDTPLRGALAKAGQYFANKAVGQGQDPVQQSCQRNITILATDGGWTKAGESAGFGPYGLGNSRGGGGALGQQDSGSGIGRPFRDSGKDQIVSLADVSYYYYNTDLRNGALGNCSGAKNAKGESPDVCKNDVKPVPGFPYEANGDMAEHQHMTTHTLGLGLNGRIPYDKDYRTKESGAFYELVNGKREWTAIADPGNNKDIMPLSHTDDLWHAAVNGRGQYFSASDSGSIVQGLSTALGMVKATTGAASAATTTSNQPVANDNDVFVSSFVSQKWIGEVQSFTIDPATGVIDSSPKAMKWSARKELDQLDLAKRNIYYLKPKSKDRREFTADNLNSDGLSKYFAGFCAGEKKGADGSLAPAQCMSLTPAQQDSANSASEMVRYLRGEQGQGYYRKRESRLGDIVNAGLLYVGKPNFPYKDDDTYLEFKGKARPAVVLAAANDGMLHAFGKEDGIEKWAYVPGPVMKNMYKLADTSYPDNHVYMVDGTPQIGDVKGRDAKGRDGWHTIVVGGLNAGGKGYYALDVTEPENPQPLWEFTHPQLGLSFGNPIITKRTNGQWVVVFASGYNNGPSSNPDENGDGQGRLFVLDALTGEPAMPPIVTTAGTKDDPSGLAKINVWVEKDRDNTMLRAYGGDLLGNLWRFDIDGKVKPYQQALLLAQLRDKSGNAQPVTTKPALAEVKSNGAPYAMVYVGTGRSLGMSDLPTDESTSPSQLQSFYAIKDPLTEAGHGNVRKGAIVTHTIAGNPRTITSGGDADLSKMIGWMLDLPGVGERVDVNPVIALDSIYVPGNIPEQQTCKAGGTSFVYKFDLKSGSKGFASSYQGDVLVQGLSVVQIATGSNKGSISTNARRSDATNQKFDDPYKGLQPQLKRSAWRSLAQ